jgi:hypothetical protein
MFPVRAPRISKTHPALFRSGILSRVWLTGLLATCILLGACAYSERYLEPGYEGRALAGKTLAVRFPDTAQILVKNPADVWACFPRAKPTSANAILAQEFGDAFMAGLDRYADFVKPLAAPDSGLAAANSGSAAPDSQRIAYARPANPDLPAHAYAVPARAQLASQGVQADLILIVDGLKSSTRKSELIAPKLGGTMQLTSLLLDGDYLIWDYAAGKPVGYGRIRSEIECKSNPSTRDWMSAFDKAVRQVIDASPFKGPKWFRS